MNHQERIDQIVKRHNAMTRNFRINVREAVRPTMIEEWEDDPSHHRLFEEDAKRDLWMRPDAYLIVPKAKLVICWEVEYAYLYPAGKYDTAFWFLEEFLWNVKVVVVHAMSGGHYTRDVLGDVYSSLRAAKAEALA